VNDAEPFPPTFAYTVLRPLFLRRTYRRLAYALVGFPLGTFYFCFLVTALSLGAGLVVTFVGIPLLAATLACCRGLAQLERTLAASLLDLPSPRTRAERHQDGFWRRMFARLGSAAAWRELAYLLLRFPAGLISFSVTVSLIAAAAGAIVQPLLVATGVPGAELGGWRTDSVGVAFLFVPAGIALLLALPGLLELESRLERSFTGFFLGRIPRADFRLAIARSLARGESDAFGLMGDLRIYFGDVPRLTPTRLEATLLTMQDLGLVSAGRDRELNRYELTAKGRKALERV
jgi:hypothetical protein